MFDPFPIATVQCRVSGDVRRNGRLARNAISRAAQAGARLVHFPEAALSGYVKSQITSWDAVDWAALADEAGRTADLAGRLGVWVVIGCNRKPAPPEPAPPGPAPPGPARDGQGARDGRPCNSLYVVSDRGAVVAHYDKRFCSHTEITSWYAPGTAPVVFDVDGVRFGCALCIEVCFPEVFAEYERRGVDCVLLSSYSDDPIHGLMARAHAATNCFWVSLAVAAQCSGQGVSGHGGSGHGVGGQGGGAPSDRRGLASALVGPDGRILAACGAGEAGFRITRLDPAAARFETALKRARPWRAQARLGEIYGHGRAQVLRHDPFGGSRA